MPIIKNCLLSISNILRNEKTSYSLIKTEQTGKLLNRKITTTPTPAKLLSYR
ncbi:secretion protein EspJ, partial [Escherichia coli]|nr:secretion protein EspJ [Escherichia coli]